MSMPPDKVSTQDLCAPPLEDQSLRAVAKALMVAGQPQDESFYSALLFV